MSLAQRTTGSTGRGEADVTRVLHVDDEPRQTELVARQLPRHDDRLVVETATSVDEARDRLAEGEIDCVITDFDMGRADASDLLTGSGGLARDVPVVLFSGSLEQAGDVLGEVDEFIRKGADGDLYDRLADLVRSAIDRRATASPKGIAD